MKNLKTKIIATYVCLGLLVLNTFGQTKSITETVKKKPVKIEKAKVPAAVTETFIVDYPVRTYENWYGYPAFADEYSWYGYDPYLYGIEYPENYVVEFRKENVPYKAIYGKTGKKIATHRKLITLPKLVLDAIKGGAYKTWAIMKNKEEIFKDSDADLMKVYKIEVAKGKEKHILFYQTDGKLLLDKTIKS
jgi:hypothetical protein